MAKRLLLVIGLALGLVLAGNASAGAQDDDGYPPDEDFITVDDTVVVVGQSITVTSGTYAPGAAVSHTFESQPVDIGTATAGSDGVAVLNTTVPDVAPGPHTITATGEDDTGGPLTQSVGITVVAADDEAADDDDAVGAVGVDDDAVGVADDAAGALPETGNDSLPLLRVGAVLLAAGGLLVFLTRRHRGESEQDEAPASA